MKRILSVFLALVLLALACGAAAEGEKWPERKMEGPTVALRPMQTATSQEQSFAGPGREYALSGSFRPNRVYHATALLREGDYFLLDVNYATARRCVYFPRWSLAAGADAAEEKLEGVAARTKELVYPVYYGPGTNYDRVTQRVRSRYADLAWEELEEEFDGDEAKIRRALKDAIHWVGLDAGTPVKVFFEVDGWVYLEANCSIGMARFWVPASAVARE